LAPLQDVINDEGDMVVPLDPWYLGLWLTGLFGDPDTTDNLDGSRPVGRIEPARDSLLSARSSAAQIVASHSDPSCPTVRGILWSG
jgi:hypothetical protein